MDDTPTITPLDLACEIGRRCDAAMPPDMAEDTRAMLAAMVMGIRARIVGALEDDTDRVEAWLGW